MDEAAASTESEHRARVGNPAPPERRDVCSEEHPPSRYGPVWWALAFSVVTTVGLGVLVWGILIAHALSYGVASVFMPASTPAGPEDSGYRLAFAVGVVVNLVSAAALARLAFQTPARTWLPAVQGLAAALLAAVAGACALLLTLGLNPFSFVAAL